MTSSIKQTDKTPTVVETEREIAIELVSKIKQRDSKAEQDMIQRYERGLKAVLFQKSKDHSIVDDVMQDTWIIVLDKVRNGEVREPGKLAAFIVQTGKYQLIMRFRKQSRTEGSLDENTAEPLANVLTPEQESQNRQLGELINVVFSELKQPRDKEIISAFYVSGESKAQLCDKYDLTPAHFDRVLFRARQRFKTLWEAHQGNNSEES